MQITTAQLLRWGTNLLLLFRIGVLFSRISVMSIDGIFIKRFEAEVCLNVI
jgi:hypothetical protein